MFEQGRGKRHQEARLATARAALAAAQTRMGVDRGPGDAAVLPLAGPLTPLIPEGLRRGRTVVVSGATSLMLALAAGPSREGAWTAVVGMPSVGVVAAARRGIDLSRVALIPHPGLQAPQVVGTCIDGMDVVLLGDRLALSDADRRRLSSRAKERGTVLVSAGPWPAAHTVLTVERNTWQGLGAGSGRLRERQLTVAVSTRSRGAVVRAQVLLDADGLHRARTGVQVDEEVA